MRFSNVLLLDSLECLWSASQWLIIRMCAPWYWSLSIAEEQSLPPDGQNSRQQYWIRYDSYSTWTHISAPLNLFQPSLEAHNNLVYIFILWCTYLFSSLSCWKNNHLCTTPAWLHPAHVVLYIYMYLEYLNVWIDFIHAIWEICIWKWIYLFNQEASKNTTAHWA